MRSRKESIVPVKGLIGGMSHKEDRLHVVEVLLFDRTAEVAILLIRSSHISYSTCLRGTATINRYGYASV